MVYTVQASVGFVDDSVENHNTEVVAYRRTSNNSNKNFRSEIQSGITLPNSCYFKLYRQLKSHPSLTTL